MIPGRIVLGIGFVAAIGVGGYVTLGSVLGEPAVASSTVGLPGDDQSPDPVVPDGPDPTTPVPVPIATFRKPDELTAPEPSGPTEPGFGTISGRIAVSTSLLKELKAYKIVVQESINPNARKPGDPKPFFHYKSFRIDWSKGTPFFDLPDIPFSSHAYRVSVVADGMNGSSAFINLTSHHPNGRGDGVQLSLTPGTVYSVILRDLRQVPRTDMEVHLVPCGASLSKRRRHDGKTNNFGNVVFEDVERGDYMLTVGKVHAPSAPPEEVTVFAASAAFHMGRPRVQGKTVIVPDGKNVTIEIWSRAGIPLGGATLLAWQLEIKRYYKFEGTTDQAGRYVFENVPYGRYQISIDHPQHGRRDRNFEVKKDGPADVMVSVAMRG